MNRIPIGPAIPKTMTLHHLSQIGDVVIGFHHDAIDARVVRVSPTVFDVPSFIAELFDTQKIMHRLPGNAGERHPAREVENDDLAALFHNPDPQSGWSENNDYDGG